MAGTKVRIAKIAAKNAAVRCSVLEIIKAPTPTGLMLNKKTVFGKHKRSNYT